MTYYKREASKEAKTMTPLELRTILFGRKYRGMKARNVIHACRTLREYLGPQLFAASNNLCWLMGSGRLNAGYLFSLQEGTAKNTCTAILALRGVVQEQNMIDAVHAAIKPIKC